MKYLLKNKDKVVLEFEVEIDSEILKGQTIHYVSLKNAKIFNENLLPRMVDKTKLLISLESWIKQRKIPKNRQFAKNVLASIPTNIEYNLMAYVDISFALSLNDSYWIIPTNKDCKWKDYNLYENEFSEALALSAFGLKMTKANGFTSSPEYTTNGMLKKCWYRENDKVCLYKCISEMYNGLGEAYSEYYMAQIAEIMEFEHINYDLKMFHNQLVSSCEIFTSENEGYLPIYTLLDESIKNYNKLRLMREIPKIYGENAFNDLMVFDALIMNIDRHLGNFGMIVDNDTGEILRPAPIFDNGLSFMATLDKNDFCNIANSLDKDISYFELQFDEQLKIFIEPRHAKNLQKLSSFNFKRHEKYNLSEEWLKPIESYIQQRAKMALRFIEEHKHKSSQDSSEYSNESDNIQTMLY